MFIPEIDLHLHSNASDGTETPSVLVRMASELGLAAISLTDHDTIEGVAEAMSEGERLGVEVIPGIELNSFFMGRPVHILGLLIDPASDSLRDFAARRREARLVRAREMIRRLAEAGKPIDMDLVLKTAEGGIVGRVHIARALVQRGAAASVSEAFKSYVRRGSPYYVSLDKPTPEQVIAVIQDAGGIAALAHPIFIPDDVLTSLLPIILSAGIGAVEVLCGLNKDKAQDIEKHLQRCSEMSAFAAEHNLARCGGSDYHGLSVKGIRLGSAHVPIQFLEELKEKHRAMQG
ncbi:PHP domain-containing protein [bacterium]|nr:PHP domain-containing protein [bacterium]